MTTNHWAIFAEGTEPRWHFGELTEEFIENTINFLNGLDGIGQELFGSGVATIKLDQRSKKMITASEIFVVSLFSTFFFVASDPLVTIKMISMLEVPEVLNDQMRGVLAGQASVLYANLYMEAETDYEAKRIDELFRQTLIDIGITQNLDAIVLEGRCSFGSFDLVEMLLFHYQLRRLFAEEYAQTDPWAIIADESGSPIHLKHGNINATSLAGYLSVLYMFCTELFDSKPRSMVFGGDSLIPLEIVNGNEIFLSISQWDKVFNDEHFINDFHQLEEAIKDRINKNIAEFIAGKLSIMINKEIKMWPVPELIKIYQNFPSFLEAKD